MQQHMQRLPHVLYAHCLPPSFCFSPARARATCSRCCTPIGSRKVASRFSGCLPMIITQESAQSLTALNRPVAADVRTPREQQDIALPLVIPLAMVMFDIFAQRSPQRALAKE